jgi:NADPH2:quinone reductase
VIDHSKSLTEQYNALQLPAPEMVFSTSNSDQYVQDIAQLIAPQGRLALIDDPEQFNIGPFKQKSISIHWEFMYTRSLFKTSDMHLQGYILNQLSDLVDREQIKSTLSGNFGTINAENLRKAHAMLESGKSFGKIVLSGF